MHQQAVNRLKIQQNQIEKIEPTIKTYLKTARSSYIVRWTFAAVTMGRPARETSIQCIGHTVMWRCRRDRRRGV